MVTPFSSFQEGDTKLDILATMATSGAQFSCPLGRSCKWEVFRMTNFLTQRKISLAPYIYGNTWSLSSFQGTDPNY